MQSRKKNATKRFRYQSTHYNRIDIASKYSSRRGGIYHSQRRERGREGRGEKWYMTRWNKANDCFLFNFPVDLILWLCLLPFSLDRLTQEMLKFRPSLASRLKLQILLDRVSTFGSPLFQACNKDENLNSGDKVGRLKSPPALFALTHQKIDSKIKTLCLEALCDKSLKPISLNTNDCK